MRITSSVATLTWWIALLSFVASFFCPAAEFSLLSILGEPVIYGYEAAFMSFYVWPNVVHIDSAWEGLVTLLLAIVSLANPTVVAVAAWQIIQGRTPTSLLALLSITTPCSWLVSMLQDTGFRFEWGYYLWASSVTGVALVSFWRRGKPPNYAINPPAGGGFTGSSRVVRSPAAGYGGR